MAEAWFTALSPPDELLRFLQEETLRGTIIGSFLSLGFCVAALYPLISVPASQCI